MGKDCNKQIKVKCYLCGKIVNKTQTQIKRGKHHFCSGKCQWKFFETLYKGENNYNWCGGTSREPYSFDFNDELRKWIKEKDNYTCQECNHTQEKLGYTLHVHHIDYDKKNSNPNNLITLCKGCNSKANFNRVVWTKHYQEKINKNKENIVKNSF